MRTPTAAEISHPTGKNQTTQLKDIQKKLPLRVLSQDDWQHWITKGFVVVKNAVSRADCARLEKAVDRIGPSAARWRCSYLYFQLGTGEKEYNIWKKIIIYRKEYRVKSMHQGL